jgi:hypothetical protein
MPALAVELRKMLEKTIVEARNLAESAARSALKRLAVDSPSPFDEMTPAQRDLRKKLRARGRQAGDLRNDDASQAIDQLTHDLAYEQWHRMLFARFLAENNLLMHPDGVPVTLDECDELAKDENAPDGYALAARYAGKMLPQIFPVGDVLLDIEFPNNDRIPLEKLVSTLPKAVFQADDSLGWAYQFWQTKKKKDVNKSETKIDHKSLSAVTQLFTEHYMVQFLLHNTIGAWWCGKNGIAGPPGGAGVPDGLAPVAFEFLRFRDDGKPAAGKFEGWPKTLREFTMLDPCCGSGHFLVAAFQLLVPLRMAEEGLSAVDACNAVLAQNLFGLELDPRCTQIAAFALALAAWTYPGPDAKPLGYRNLPALNIACSGQGVVGKKDEWKKLANGDSRFQEGMERIYDLFSMAPLLGSLIDPRIETGDIFALGYDVLKPTLARALEREANRSDPDRAAVGVAAQGIAMAASLMTREFTLVATNVPYLSRGKQCQELRDYLEKHHQDAKADLATAFVERCLDYCSKGGTIAAVTPQNWLFLGSYKKLRERLLKHVSWNVVVKLGENGFESAQAAGAFSALIALTSSKPHEKHDLLGMDASDSSIKDSKERYLLKAQIYQCSQLNLSANSEFAIVVKNNKINECNALEFYASIYQGASTTDSSRFTIKYWEIQQITDGWEKYQLASEGDFFSGLNSLVYWENGRGELSKINTSKKGEKAMGKKGIGISVTRNLHKSIYMGYRFDGTIAVIVPFDNKYKSAIWSFITNRNFNNCVRIYDSALSVTESSFLKIPFDIDHWQNVAAEEYPNGLPEPYSDDPTQWIFKGIPKGSTDPLQVAVARLMGYRWPDQVPDALDSLADRDGIVPIPAMRDEPSASERLIEVLRIAYGDDWSTSILDKLLVDSGSKPGTSLDDWIRNEFFERHYRRFHNRPFIWHIWDGRKDGFGCLVNYHKLNHKKLESLTYSYLQDWITLQTSGARSGVVGADLRLKAANELQEKLRLILEGEPPYDIFVRWKPLDEQAIGWNPDLNDGVRMNIRPFMKAGILRKNPNIKWGKDRGKEPKRDESKFPWFNAAGDRINDVHLTIAEKRTARQAAGKQD